MNESRIIVPGATAPLSGRQARRAIGDTQEAVSTLSEAMVRFMSLGFGGRVRWLLFGMPRVKVRRPSPAQEA